MVNNEGNGILLIRISHEEKHGIDDEISLSSDENNRARPPLRCDIYIYIYRYIKSIYLLASNTLKPSGVSWEARAISPIVNQVSEITDIEQLESIINCVIKSTLFRTDLELRNLKEYFLGECTDSQSTVGSFCTRFI